MEIKTFRLWPTYWLYPILDFEGNLADGEVKKFKGVEDTTPGRRLSEPCHEGFDKLWVSIGFGYYKCISKTKE